MRGDADRRKVRILLKLDSQLPCVLGDRIHLQQVILNVVFNAMDAMSKCSPAARVITIETTASAGAAGDEVEIAVADSGPGIPAHQLAHIFHSFFTTKPNGMGMGLAIARSIIEAHGGRIWAESRLGEGTIFRFSLRVADDAEVPALRHRPTSSLTSKVSTIT
jgi:signal transduction histidine kinase